MKQTPSSTAGPTVLGILAIGLWSTVFALSRSLAEQLGPLTSAMLIFLGAGLIGSVWSLLAGGAGRAMRRLPRAYLFGAGALFVLYQVAIYTAIGFASGRRQLIEVGIINYLWPGLTLVLAIPILGRPGGSTQSKPAGRAWLAAGIVMATAGIVLAMAEPGLLSWEGFRANFRTNAGPYGLALVAAVAWALYSNLRRRWAAGDTAAAETRAVPLFLLAAGAVLAVVRFCRPETSHWTWQAGAELAYMAVAATLLAYVFWDVAVRRGRMILVVSLSYLVPVLSTVTSSLYLGVRLGPDLWAACGLVVAGAVVCRLAVKET